jgi:hypothetical protein
MGFGEVFIPAIERPLSLYRCDARFVLVVGGFRGRPVVLWRVGHYVRARTTIVGVVDRKELHFVQLTW